MCMCGIRSHASSKQPALQEACRVALASRLGQLHPGADRTFGRAPLRCTGIPALLQRDAVNAYCCPDALAGRDESCPEEVRSPAPVRLLVGGWTTAPPALPGIPCKHSFSSER